MKRKNLIVRKVKKDYSLIKDTKTLELYKKFKYVNWLGFKTLSRNQY